MAGNRGSVGELEREGGLAGFRLLRTTTPEPSELSVDGRSVPVLLKRNPRARRFIIRIDETGSRVVITLPMRASQKRAMEFARSQAGWIIDRLAAAPVAQPFIDGASLPVRAEAHRIVHTPQGRGVKAGYDAAGDRIIEVAGAPTHLARRLGDWLKAEARRELVAASHAYAEALEVKFRRVSIRDPASRWGSCSAKGDLSYSWRLILAPSFVLRYVAAHEVAHLVELNHSARFWTVVRKLNPDVAAARRWMRLHGRDLHRYGRTG